MRIEIRPDVPKEISESVVPFIEKYQLLFPLWLQRCVISWRPAEDYTMRILVHDDYRQCFIDVSSGWLDCETDIKEDSVIHEIVHCFTVQLKCEAENWMIDFQLEDNVKNAYMRQIARVMEQVTQDAAYSIKRYSDSLA